MPLPTETIVCDVTLASGAEFEAGRASIVFKLDKPDWDTDANEAIPANELRFPLDADGQTTVTLWPNDRGSVGSVYQVWVEERTTGFGVGFNAKTTYPVIRVVDGGGPYNLTGLFDQSAPPAPFRVVGFLTQAEYDAAIAAGQQAQAAALSIPSMQQTFISGTSYMLSAADAGRLLVFTGANPATLIIPAGIANVENGGPIFNVLWYGDGQPIIQPASGVTLDGESDPVPVPLRYSAPVTLIKLSSAPDTFIALGVF